MFKWKPFTITSVFFVLFIAYGIAFPIENVNANTSDENPQNNSNYIIFETISLDNCDINDPSAICKLEVFGYAVPDVSQKKLLTTRSSSYNVTCGINIVNQFQAVVGQLSQTSTVTWRDWGYSWNNSSRSATTVNTLYSWGTISGPSPSTGSGNYNTEKLITTTGQMKYLGMNWKTFQVKTFISGGTIPGMYWHCGWSEIY